MKKHTGREWYIFPFVTGITLTIAVDVADLIDSHTQPFILKYVRSVEAVFIISILQLAVFLATAVLTSSVLFKLLNVKK